MSPNAHRSRSAARLALLLLGASAWLAGCGEVRTRTPCRYREQDLAEGAVVVDGCNTCTCNADGSVTCTADACADCTHEGEDYGVGESFPAGDGCNLCTCMAVGEVSCTTAQCGTSCVYGGVQYVSGQSFPSLDGCNTCECSAGGTVACTEKACPCDPPNEWWKDYASTDPEECEVIDFGCPDNTTGFDNDCGCGCEQDASCAKTYDCQPPTECDIEALAAKCPYSEILK